MERLVTGCNTCRWSPPGRLRRYLPIIVMLGVAALTVQTAMAAGKGRFEVRTVSTSLESSVHYLNARVDYELSEEAEEALRSGVTLRIQLQIRVRRARRLWLDADVAELAQSYELNYQALSNRYVVRNVNSGDIASFANLFSALAHLGRVADLPVIDSALLDSGGRYYVTVRSVLDRENLPGPLQVLAFWRGDFSLESEWYRWPLSS